MAPKDSAPSTPAPAAVPAAAQPQAGPSLPPSRPDLIVRGRDLPAERPDLRVLNETHGRGITLEKKGSDK
jgi:hypothetical protein